MSSENNHNLEDILMKVGFAAGVATGIYLGQKYLGSRDIGFTFEHLSGYVWYHGLVGLFGGAIGLRAGQYAARTIDYFRRD